MPNAGTLDPTFGTGGQLTTSVGVGTTSANAIAVGPDGKIAVVGLGQNTVSTYGFSVTVYNSNGTLDTNFSAGGSVVTDLSPSGSIANGVTFQPDGKVVVVGYSQDTTAQDFLVVRYNTDGVLDSTFGSGGIARTDYAGKRDIANCVTVQSDGKIVVGGTMVRHNFDSDHFALVRYNTDGTRDTSFGAQGIVVTALSTIADYAYGLAIDAAGNIVLGGQATYADSASLWRSKMAVARYLPNGKLDATFSGDGIAFAQATNDDFGRGVAIQADGKIVLVGTSVSANPSSFTLARFNANGSLDTDFQGGTVRTTIGTGAAFAQSVAIQANGKIVAAGENGKNTGFALARYNADGTLDSSFTGDGTEVVAFASPTGSTNSIGRAMTLQLDGRIVMAGQYWEGSSAIQKVGLARFIGDPLPPTVTSVVFGDGTAQRSNVKQLVVNFSEPVEFMGDVTSAFTLTRTSSTPGDVTLAAASITGHVSSVTITFSGDMTEFGSLADGYYDFTISAAQVSGVAGALDGNGDRVAGGSYFRAGTSTNKFFRLFGDSNGDAVATLSDFAAFRSAFGLGPSNIFDFDQDSEVGLGDFAAFRSRFNLTL